GWLTFGGAPAVPGPGRLTRSMNRSTDRRFGRPPPTAVQWPGVRAPVRPPHRQARPERPDPPRRYAPGRLRLAPAEDRPRGHRLPERRERLQRRGDEADGALPGVALHRDAGANKGGRQLRAVPARALLLLLPHREGQAVPD